MLLDGTWGCQRLWYQGPPGARGCYFYRNLRHPPCRPMLRIRRFHWRTLLIGTRRHFIAWNFAYDK